MAGLLLEDNRVLGAAACAKAAGVEGDFGSVRRILCAPNGLENLKKLASWAQNSDWKGYEKRSEVTLLAPVPDPEKVLGVALNYRDFCVRGNLPIPEKLKVFGKYATSVNRDGGEVAIQGRKVTYEGELGVVVGEYCRNVSTARALNYVAGYTVVNDCTANDYVKEDVQLLRGKNLDGFLPMGPVLVTADEIPDPGCLNLRTVVNGEVRQDSNTSQLIFGIGALIEYFSAFMTLSPGDVIATGTPAGTALQFDPPRFLQPGDRVEVTVQGIGSLHSVIV